MPSEAPVANAQLRSPMHRLPIPLTIREWLRNIGRMVTEREKWNCSERKLY